MEEKLTSRNTFHGRGFAGEVLDARRLHSRIILLHSVRCVNGNQRY
jgi:hypothetical protein